MEQIKSINDNKKKFIKDILNEYSLKRNNFNPSKPSPNMFIKKLEIRMKKYYKDLYSSYRA